MTRKKPANALPRHASSVWAHLQKTKYKDYPFAPKLFAARVEIRSLWNTLAEFHPEAYDDLWVWAFLDRCKAATTVPAYHQLPPWERKDNANKIDAAVKKLNRLLRENGLDAHLYQTKVGGQLQLRVAEDSSHRERILDDENVPKVLLTEIIEHIGERSRDLLTQRAIAKQGKGVLAVYFVRVLSALNHRCYNTPLHSVVAIACNAIYETPYDQEDIHHLLKRISDKSFSEKN